MDREGKIVASAMSAIFKINQNKKRGSGELSQVPIYQVSSKYLQLLLR
jgi:hypothetical protein